MGDCASPSDRPSHLNAGGWETSATVARMAGHRRLLGVLAASVLLIAAVLLPTGADAPEALAIQVDVRADDAAPDFRAVLADVLTDPRGWAAAGAQFDLVDESLYRIGVAASGDMSAACAPYDSASKFACRPGTVGMINAELWETPPQWWPGDLEGYRRHAVNHELGHLLGIRAHPPCPGLGQPLPVMALPPRDTTECRSEGWPTPREADSLRQALAATS